MGKVLAFNRFKKLVGILASAYVAGKTYKIAPSSVRNACVGRCLTVADMYFRYVTDEVAITEIGNLSLIEYDERNGIVRRKWRTSKICKKGRPPRRSNVSYGNKKIDKRISKEIQREKEEKHRKAVDEIMKLI